MKVLANVIAAIGLSALCVSQATANAIYEWQTISTSPTIASMRFTFGVDEVAFVTNGINERVTTFRDMGLGFGWNVNDNFGTNFPIPTAIEFVFGQINGRPPAQYNKLQSTFVTAGQGTYLFQLQHLGPDKFSGLMRVNGGDGFIDIQSDAAGEVWTVLGANSDPTCLAPGMPEPINQFGCSGATGRFVRVPITSTS
jgi:hypothetical protein